MSASPPRRSGIIPFASDREAPEASAIPAVPSGDADAEGVEETAREQRPNRTVSIRDCLVRIRQLRSDNELYKRHFDKLHGEYKQLDLFHREQVAQWETQLGAARHELEQHQDQFDRRTVEMNSLQRALFEEKELTKQLKANLEQFDSMQSELRNKKDELQTLYDQIEVNNERYRRDIEKVNRDWSEKLEVEVMRAKGGVLDPSDAIERRDSEKIIGDLKSRLAVAVQSCKGLETELEDVRKEKALLRAAKEEGAVLHSRKYAEVVSSHRALEARLERLTNQNRVLEDRATSHSDLLERHHQRVLVLEKQLAEQKSRSAEAERSRDVAIKRVEGERKRAVRELQGEIERVTALLDSKQQELQTLKRDREVWESRLSHQMEEESERAGLEVRREATKRRDLEAKVASLQSELRDVQRSAEGRLIEVRKDLARSTKTSTGFKEESETLRAEVTSLELASERQRLEIRRHKKATIELEGSIEDLQDSLSELRTRLARVEEDRDEAVAKIEKCELLVEFKERERSEAIAEFEKAREAIAALRGDFSKTTGELQRRVRSETMSLQRVRKSREELKSACRRKIGRLKRLLQRKDQDILEMEAKAHTAEEEARRKLDHARKECSRWRREADKARFMVGMGGGGGGVLRMESGGVAAGDGFEKQFQEMAKIKQDMSQLLRM